MSLWEQIEIRKIASKYVRECCETTFDGLIMYYKDIEKMIDEICNIKYNVTKE